MTIPMMPGFWDQNGEALTQLAQMATRIVNPYYDNQVALTQMMRQNPAVMQQAVDLSYLNPDMFAQTYGPRMLQQMAEMGRPSSGAQIEEAGRGVLNAPAGAAPNTVAAQAFIAKSGAPTNLEARTTEAQIAGTEINTALGKNKLEQTEFEQRLRNPVLQAQLQTLDNVIQSDSAAILADPRQLATDYVQGKADPRKITALSLNEPLYEQFNKYVDTLLQGTRDAAQFNRQFRLEQNRWEREDNALERQARKAAFEASMQFGGNVDDYYNWYMGKDLDNPNVREAFRNNANTQRTMERLKQLQSLAPTIREFQGKRGAQRGPARLLLEEQMSAIIGMPVKLIQEPSGTGITERFTKEWKFRVNGQEVDGEQIETIAAEGGREYFNNQAEVERYSAMPATDIQNMINATQNAYNSGSIEVSVYSQTMANLTEALKKSQQQATRGARSR